MMNFFIPSMHRILLFIFSVVVFFSCSEKEKPSSYSSENLIIEQISEHTYRHITYLQTEQWGKVPCNGLIVVSQGEAIVMDTPPDEASANELINWLTDSLDCQVKGVIATHFHIDCVGALDAFHALRIPSYGNQMTIDLANEAGNLEPENVIGLSSELQVGGIKIQNQFCGAGHTKDNMVCYIPADSVLFGGCLVKALKAGKGNLEDANVDAWSTTIETVKSTFPAIKIVIPGHGNVGSVDLLDYTIEKFKKE